MLPPDLHPRVERWGGVWVWLAHGRILHPGDRRKPAAGGPRTDGRNSRSCWQMELARAEKDGD